MMFCWLNAPHTRNNHKHMQRSGQFNRSACRRFLRTGKSETNKKKIMKTIRSSVEFFKFILTTRSQPPHIANKHIVVSIVDSVYEFWQLLLSPVMRSSDRIKLLDDDEKRNILWNCFYFYFGIFAACVLDENAHALALLCALMRCEVYSLLREMGRIHSFKFISRWHLIENNKLSPQWLKWVGDFNRSCDVLIGQLMHCSWCHSIENLTPSCIGIWFVIRRIEFEIKSCAINAFSFSSACYSWKPLGKRKSQNDTKDRQPRRTLPTRAHILSLFILSRCFCFCFLFENYPHAHRLPMKCVMSATATTTTTSAFTVQDSEVCNSYLSVSWKSLFSRATRIDRINIYIFSFSLKLIKSHSNKSDPFNVNAARIHWLLSFDMRNFACGACSLLKF